MKRKALLVLLTLCLALCLVATSCSLGGTDDSSSSTESSETKSETEVGTESRGPSGNDTTDSSVTTDDSEGTTDVSSDVVVDSGTTSDSSNAMTDTSSAVVDSANTSDSSSEIVDSSITIDSSGNIDDSNNDIDNPELPHVHEYGTWSTLEEASCTKEGLKEKKCFCGDTVTEAIEITEHFYKNGYCSICKKAEPASEGLEYTLSDDKTYYTITGIGICKDNNICIPSGYNDLPVKSIGDYAFEDCLYLTDITIGKSVTDIGFAAFRGCESLTSVTIPASVTTIGDYAFERCKTLAYITVDGNNTTYKSVDGNLYTKDGKLFIQYAIGKSDETFTIPEGVTTIESFAFVNCENLTSIIIPNSITNRECFRDSLSECTNIMSFIIDEENTAFKSIDGNVYAKSGKALIKYAVGKSEEKYVIPNGVVTIEGSAFMNCTNLTNVVIPNSVTSIGEFAFSHCTNLSTVTIPSSVVKISMFAFSHCTNLTNITIENSITSIGYSAFSSCTSLKTITIPGSVTNIGTYAFKDCTSLTRVLIEAGVKSIESSVFSGCTNLVINCEEETQPDGWNSYWNYSNCPVNWGYSEEN